MHDLEKSCGWQPFTSVCRRIHPDTFTTGSSARYLCIRRQYELERRIDDERQFKMAKRSQAPGDANVLKRVFRDNFVIFRRRSKRIAFWNQRILFSIFVVVTWPLFGTIQGPIFAKCLVTDSRLAKGTPSESRLSIGTIGLGFGVKLFPIGCAHDSRRVPKNTKNVIFIWLQPRYKFRHFSR